MKLLIINGPNINMLGIREPDIYGKDDYKALCDTIKSACEGIEYKIFTSNHEGEIIDEIQSSLGNFDGIIINAGGYTHTSVAILDALKAVSLPTVEVHISNPAEREEFRHFSYISLAAEKTIAGHGIRGYAEAVEYLRAKLCQ